jgi:hypothetical protein
MASLTLTRQQLYDRVWATRIDSLAITLGLSGRGLGKLCARYDIPVPPRGYWAKRAAGKKVAQPELPFPVRADLKISFTTAGEETGDEPPTSATEGAWITVLEESVAITIRRGDEKRRASRHIHGAEADRPRPRLPSAEDRSGAFRLVIAGHHERPSCPAAVVRSSVEAARAHAEPLCRWIGQSRARIEASARRRGAPGARAARGGTAPGEESRRQAEIARRWREEQGKVERFERLAASWRRNGDLRRFAEEIRPHDERRNDGAKERERSGQHTDHDECVHRIALAFAITPLIRGSTYVDGCEPPAVRAEPFANPQAHCVDS